MELIRGSDTAKAIRRKIRRMLEKEDGIPALAVIRSGEDALALLYEESLRRCFAKTGMRIHTVTLSGQTEPGSFLDAVQAADASSENDGVLVLKPFPPGVSLRAVAERLSPGKDVDGAGYFADRERARFLPGTACAAFALLDHLGISVKDRNFAVLGRSETAGRPVAAEAVMRGASVAMIGSGTEAPERYLRDADIIFSAVGKAGLITGDMLKPGAVLLDAGLTRGADGFLRGDCDRESVSEKAAFLTPAVNGIGSVTASVIALHTAEAFLKRKGSGVRIPIRYFTDGIEKLRYIDGKSDWIDLRCAEQTVLRAGEMKLIPLGVAMKLPEGYEAHILPRSSSFRNFGILQANSCGVVDESYSGTNDQWFFPALAVRDTVIRVNDRICQFRIVKHQPPVSFQERETLDGHDRGGFGTTGKQ